MALLIIGMTTPTVFADLGEPDGIPTPRQVVDTNDLLPIDGIAPIFFGKGGWSADACGTSGTNCSLDAEVTDGATVEGAWLYAVTAQTCPASVNLLFDGTPYTLPELVHNTFDAFSLCSYRVEVTDQVEATIAGAGGITTFSVTELVDFDGTALVVVFSDADEKETSVIILDGGLDSDGATTTVGLAAPLDKTVSGFEATLSLGINFGFQGPAGGNTCGTGPGQDSKVDINGVRLTSCAGNFDDGTFEIGGNALITVGGVGDSTDNPADPFQEAGDGGSPRVEEDELYDIAGFLSQGDTEIVIDTVNDSDDDNIFLAIIAITAKASLEICDNGIDDDGDGLIDLDDPDCIIITPPPPPPTPQPPVGGEFLPIENTALLLVGLQSSAIWMLPVLAGAAGAGVYYIKTRMNKE